MPVQPYLFFDGRCEEAVEFYQAGAGRRAGDADALQDSPDPPPPGMVPPGSEHKVMHCSFKIGDDRGDGLGRQLRRRGACSRASA